MRPEFSSHRRIRAVLLTAFALSLTSTSASAEPPGQSPGMADDAMAMEMAHPFMSHMGLPDPPGASSLRLTGIQRTGDAGSGTDIAIHAEAGIAPRLGIHLRNDAIIGAASGMPGMPSEDLSTEFMVMYALLQDAAGTQGLSLFAEVEWPTVQGDGWPVNVGAGLAGRLQWCDRLSFDGAVHVSPGKQGVEVGLEGSLQFRPAGRLYAIIESRAMLGPEETMAYLLAAVKVGLGSTSALGVGVQVPLTAARDYDRQVMFQLDLEF